MSQSRNHITSIGPVGPILSRRVFVSGAVMGATALAGAALPKPAQAYGGGGAPSGAGSRSGAASGAGQAKEPKATARYQDSPNGNQQCSRCTHFRPPNSCQIVEGSVSPNGWCRHFKPAA